MKRTIGMILILVALFVPGMLALTALPPLLEAHGLRADVDHFATAACVPLGATARNRSSKYHTYYAPVLHCAFDVAGARYAVDSRYLDLDSGYPSPITATAAGDRMLKTAPPTVYYDPADPSRAVLSRTVTSSDADWFIVAIGVVFLGIDLLMLGMLALTGVRALRARRVAREEFPAARIVEP